MLSFSKSTNLYKALQDTHTNKIFIEASSAAQRCWVPSITPRLKSRVRLTFVVTLVGAISLVPIGVVSAAARGNRLTMAGSAVKPDFAYFAGKSIEFVDGSTPGAGGDTYMRFIAPLVASYLHCNVNVINMTGTGSIAAQNFAANSAPNGLTVGEMTAGNNIAAGMVGTPTPSFSMQKVPLLAAATGNAPTPLVATPSNAIKNIKEFMENKNKASYSVATISGASFTVALAGLLKAYNVSARFVMGYTNALSVAVGFNRGDAPFAITSATSLLPYITSGLAIPLLLLGDSPWTAGLGDYSYMKKVPDLPKFAANYPPKSKAGKALIKAVEALVQAPAYVYFVSPGTPANLTLALNDAIRSALAQPGVKSQFHALGVNIGSESGKLALKQIRLATQHGALLNGLGS